MYTHTRFEREHLNDVIERLVLPEVRNAIWLAASIFVDELEDFHPDIAYEAHVQEAADEIRLRLCEHLGNIRWEDTLLEDEVLAL